MFAKLLVIALVAISSFAHPIRQEAREIHIVGQTQPAKRAAPAAEFEILAQGNQRFRDNIQAEDPGLLSRLTADGQAPPFMFLGCSDSRVSEGTVFNAKPGTLFTSRNIANRFERTDTNTHATVSYAISVLGVQHVIVMGHYGCGGVAAAIATPAISPVPAAFEEVENWIAPIRELFQTSTRPEIVELRERIRDLPFVEEPEVTEPGFRALVEENVKQSVHRIATSSIVANHYHTLSLNATGAPIERREEAAPLVNVFIHGMVYDIENGIVQDLGVSVGPPGVEIPTLPFSAVANAGQQFALQHNSAHEVAPGHAAPVAPVAHPAPPVSVHPAPPASAHEARGQCEQWCKARRAIAGAFGL